MRALLFLRTVPQCVGHLSEFRFCPSVLLTVANYLLQIIADVKKYPLHEVVYQIILMVNVHVRSDFRTKSQMRVLRMDVGHFKAEEVASPYLNL